MDPFYYYAPPHQQGREKGAAKRDNDFAFFTPRARGAVTELRWGPFLSQDPSTCMSPILQGTIQQLWSLMFIRIFWKCLEVAITVNNYSSFNSALHALLTVRQKWTTAETFAIGIICFLSPFTLGIRFWWNSRIQLMIAHSEEANTFRTNNIYWRC